MRLRLLIAGALLVAAQQAAGADCANFDHKGDSYTVCTVANADELDLWNEDADGTPYGTFAGVDRALNSEGKRLGLAMNGGMYHEDRRPVGLHIEDGVQTAPLVTRDGPGNFGLLPNGVFCVDGIGAKVIESRTFAKNPPKCRIATQSGPMLVIDGELHPKFLPDSTSLKRRNGVGVDTSGTTYFAISNGAVRFHDMATLFRDMLGVPNALFLDGSVSRMYAPSLNRADGGLRMGPIIGQVLQQN